MDHRDDARAAELNNLRLALVTFALQLDVFESRIRSASTGSRAEPERHGPTPDWGLRKEA
jgi:hypothetical protein